MLDLITGYWTSQLLYVVARLGVADQMGRRARPVAELAAAVGADADRLHRVLRALAAKGVCEEKKPGHFALTPLGTTLRADAPFSMRDFARMMVDDYNWQGWGALLDGVVQPTLPFAKVFGKEIFEYLHGEPAKLQTFAASMASISATENPAVAAAFDFGRCARLVDVGGSQGHLLAAILRAHPRVHGTLFDLPDVVAHARTASFLTAADLRARVEFATGDFFAAVPPGADGYVMKYVLHDWSDERCVRILTNCRNAMAKGGRVLIVDTVIPRGNGPHWGKQLDINMLVLTGGKERTATDFAALCARAGLRVRKVHATACPLSVVEAVAAS